MAEYYETTNPSTQKLWAKRLWIEHRKSDALFDPANGLMGKDPENNAWVHMDETEKGIGDRVTVTLSLQIAGRGVIGDDVLEGKEVPLDTTTFGFTLDDQVQGVRSRGRMNAQRVSFDTMEESKRMLRQWWKTRRAVQAMNQLTGNSRQTDLAFTGLNSVAEPDSNHILRANQTVLGASNDQTVGGDTTATFDVHHIDQLVTFAEASTPPIRPFIYKGNPYYGILIHPYVMEDLRDSGSRWYQIMRDALQGGFNDGNPLFTRAAGMWRNCLIYTDPHVPQGRDSGTGAAVANTRRCVFFGACALVLCYGRYDKGDKDHLRWYSGTWDNGRKYYASAGMVHGMKSPRFTINGTPQDYGKIVLTVYSVDRLQYNYGGIPTFDLGQTY